LNARNSGKGSGAAVAREVGNKPKMLSSNTGKGWAKPKPSLSNAKIIEKKVGGGNYSSRKIERIGMDHHVRGGEEKSTWCKEGRSKPEGRKPAIVGK